VLALAGAGQAQASSPGGEKSIRLRNETIVTPAVNQAVRALQPQANEAPVSGLFLIQFEGPLEVSWRDSLRTVGVELVRYVPEDAFVARLQDCRAGVVRCLSFVRWLGPFKGFHKVHQRLLAPAPLADPGAVTWAVRVLISPVAREAELAALREPMRNLQLQSRSVYGTILAGPLSLAQIAHLADSPAVLWIEPAPKPKLSDEAAVRIVAGGGDGGLGSPMVHAWGFDGRGVVVSVADTGLQEGIVDTMHPDLFGRVDAFFHYGELESAADGHGHGTHVAGIVAGDGATGETDEGGLLYGLGVAPGSRLVVQRIYDDAGNFRPPAGMETLTRDAVRAGALVGSNSWGEENQGRYDLSAAEFDALVRDADAEMPGDQPYVLEFSVGNAGPAPQTIASPAVAKNVIATGASQNGRPDLFTGGEGQPERVAGFSSRGPCEDGRWKPDLVAPGTWIASLQSAAASPKNAWLAISDHYQYQGGTSQAGPHVSGAAAVFIQYYRETHGGQTPSPALVKAALINSAHDLDNVEGATEPVPNLEEGWGRVSLANLIGGPRRFEFIDQATPLTNQQVFEHRVVVGGSAQSLKLTLAYTDVPALPAAIPALVNDLDLEVEAPDGTIFRGNQFLGGVSVANAEGRDNLNNVEGVHLPQPQPGQYRVRIIARSVAEDVYRQADAAPRQDFALVVSGQLPVPGLGVLVFDRDAYRVPDAVWVRLIDFDLAGRESVQVTIRSATEPAGEVLTLYPNGSAGVFTNWIVTAPGSQISVPPPPGGPPPDPPPVDGRLQVLVGDWIEGVYVDASPRAEVRAKATLDSRPPTIREVLLANRFNQVVITWQTDEPADSWVRYGLSSSLGEWAGSQALTERHEVVIDGLVPGRTYGFEVMSRDAAGNAATHNNAGAYFQHEAPNSPTVLVVSDFDDLHLDLAVTAYTDALEGAKISYRVWDVRREGRTPRLQELRRFQAVMWRVPEFLRGWSAADVKALGDYVDGGGSLFVASMELLSRLDEAGFANFRRNVLHVESYDADPGISTLEGISHISLTSGLRLIPDFSSYPNLGVLPSDLSDTITPTTNAAPILRDALSGQVVGLRYPRASEESGGRVVFLSFPLDVIPLHAPAPDNRIEFVRRVISFLVPGLNGFAGLELDREAYAIPSRATIAVADADQAHAARLAVQVFTESLPLGQTVLLSETSRPGLFRGVITLVEPGPSLAAGLAHLQDGESFRVVYDDTSSRRAWTVSAQAETTPPVIGEVGVDIGYAEAVVRWSTSELTDALVQYGESRFLGRTAYSPALARSHRISLSGLAPGRDYFCQLVSRDAAGNTTVDDNQGRLYAFRTRTPIVPPFQDDLESGALQWTAKQDKLPWATASDLPIATWQLGKPSNALARGAHSGNNAWGTNLRGWANDVVHTWLISPALDLTRGNRATLKFWHLYDFQPRSAEGELSEFGQVTLSTNNGSAWLPLTEYPQGTRSDGWVEEAIDLSAYAGKVVWIGWRYNLTSIGGVAHPGWLVDDITVTLTNVIRGVITVTNNLAQASFRVQGPDLDARASGWHGSFSDARPGTYVVTFDPVAFYDTPSPQTNQLDGAAPLTFRGTYTFPDANQNGISDAWEQEHFGGLITNRLVTADSDGDGAIDQAEFLAGTDPRQADSALRLLPLVMSPSREIVLSWVSVPGRAYRVEGSANLRDWAAFTTWIRASHTVSSASLPAALANRNYLFRLEVKP
jgi:hypothetical protein